MEEEEREKRRREKSNGGWRSNSPIGTSAHAWKGPAGGAWSFNLKPPSTERRQSVRLPATRIRKDSRQTVLKGDHKDQAGSSLICAVMHSNTVPTHTPQTSMRGAHEGRLVPQSLRIQGLFPTTRSTESKGSL